MIRENIKQILNENYVNPRDFFNMANLFKVYGFVAVYLHDRQGAFPRIEINDETSDGYDYGFDGAYGYTISNYNLYLDGEPIFMYIPINSREKNPLYAIYNDEEYEVLDGSGKLTDEFLELIS